MDFDFLDLFFTLLGELLSKVIKKVFNIDLNFKDGGHCILGFAFVVLIIAIPVLILS